MNPILVTPAPFRRKKHQFGKGDEFGVYVAHDDFLLAALRHTGASVAVLRPVLDGPLSLSHTEPREEFEALSDLARDFGPERVRTGELHSYRHSLSGLAPVFFTGGPEINKAVAFRDLQPAGSSFPILNVLHSSYWMDLGQQYVTMLLGAKPYDRYVCTSRAGLQQVRSTVEHANEFLSRKLGFEAIPDPHARLRTELLPLGVHASDFKQMPKLLARELLDLPANAEILLYLGRLSEEYKADLEPLIRVAAELKRERPNTVLVLAGQDSENTYRPQLLRMASRWGLNDGLKIVSNFPLFLKSAIYRAADIFVSPVDNIQETFGISILEAMCCGLPVVASDWSGYRDLVVDGETGMLVDTIWNPEAGDRANQVLPYLSVYEVAHFLAQRTIVNVASLRSALNRLLDDPELRERMGAAGKRRVALEYDWQVLASRYEALWIEQLEQLANSAPAPELPNSTINMNELYAHMASRSSAPQDRVASRDPALATAVVKENRRAFGSTSIRDRAAALASKIGPFPVSAKELGPGPVTADALAWLVKRGLCEPLNSPRVSEETERSRSFAATV